MGKNDKKGKGGGGGDKEAGGKAKGAQSINVRHILVSAQLHTHPTTDMPMLMHFQCEKHSKKEEALAKLNDGVKFDEVARNFSEDKARQGECLSKVQRVFYEKTDRHDQEVPWDGKRRATWIRSLKR